MAGLIDCETKHSLILTSSSLSVNIDGFMSSILASLTYFNQFDHEVEGLFVFDDSEACVTGLQASVVNQNIHLEIREQTTVRKNSEGQTVRAQQKTQNGFSISIGRIPPNVNVLLEVNVIGELQTANGEALVFKTAQVFTPFWEQPLNISPQNEVNDPERRCITEHPYAFDIKIRAGMPCLLAGCFSPSHAIRVDADVDATSAETVVITLAEKFKYDREIEILFYPSQPLEPYAAIEPGLESRSEEIPRDFLSNAILAVSFMPDLPAKTAVFREFVFMVDRSGSMNGSHICDAKEGLVLFLKSLPTTAYFNVVCFGSYSRTLFPTSQPYNQENVDKGCAYVNSIRADMGGSELLQPLKVVLEKPLRIGYPRNIFLLTDGDISHPETILKYLRMRVNSHNARIFAFGIGPKISYETVSNIARAGQGKAYFASQQGNIQTKIVQCLKEAQQPLLCNITVDWQLPDTFKIHHACHEIPFATHGQRLNLFASVSLPSRAQRQASLKESHSSSNGIKEFWFDEDFESCQLGDSNEFLDDPRSQDEFLGDWDSDDTDIRSQCSDYEPLVNESEDHVSEPDRGQVERQEDDGKEYGEKKSTAERLGGNYVENNQNNNSTFTMAAFKTSSSETRSETDTSTDNNYSTSSTTEAQSFACIDNDSNVRSLDKNTLNNMKTNYKEINERNEGGKETDERNEESKQRGTISCHDRNTNWKSQQNVINTFTYNSGLSTRFEDDMNTSTTEHTVYYNNKDTYRELNFDEETERNSDSHPASSGNPLFNNTMGRRNASERGVQGQNNSSTDQQNQTSNDTSLLGSIKRDQKEVNPSCLRNTSQPSLTDLYDAPLTRSHHSAGYGDSAVHQTILNSKSLTTNHQSNPPPSRHQTSDRWSKNLSTKYPLTEGNKECNQSLSGCYPCEQGYVMLSGFLGANVYTKKVPFCLRLTPSKEYRDGDLHQMAAVSFIQGMEKKLDSTQVDDGLERDIIELSKMSGVPSRITSQVTVDEQGRVTDIRQDSLFSTIIRRRRSSLTTCAYKHFAKSTCSEDEPPAILVSCPSVDEEPRAPPKQRYQTTIDTDHLSDEDGSYYRLERLAPEGCDEVKPSCDTTGRHHRKRLVECRNTPVKTIQRRKLVSARLTLLTKRMKHAQKLNVFAGPPFIRLILLQAAQGYWQLTYAFARIIELPLVQLELAAPFADCTMIPLGDQDEQLGIDCYYDSLSLWATAVAMVYLKKKWESHKENWELVAVKAETWLKEQTFPQGFSYLDVMLAARQAIVLLEQKYRSRARSEPVVTRT